MANREWMMNGNGEGIVITSESAGESSQISKWKVGAEMNECNVQFLEELIEEAEGGQLYLEDKDKAIELFNVLLEIQSSNKVMGFTP